MIRNVLVTGASGNLGREVVKHFVEKGSRVFGLMLHNDSFGKEYNHVLFEKIYVDLTNEIETTTVMHAIIKKHDHIDLAILTAGGYEGGGFLQTTSADIQQMMNINFFTCYSVARILLLQMKQQQEGKIMLVGSRQGLNPKESKDNLGYALSKSLIFNLADMMNKEGENNNVITKVLVPTIIDTPQNRAAMPKADTKSWDKPEKIAELIYTKCASKDWDKSDKIIFVRK
jgi:short-subunit dehydrogenase